MNTAVEASVRTVHGVQSLATTLLIWSVPPREKALFPLLTIKSNVAAHNAVLHNHATRAAATTAIAAQSLRQLTHWLRRPLNLTGLLKVQDVQRRVAVVV